MCGLVGIAGNIYPTHKKMFRDMLILDQLRGMDSTGVAVVYNSKHKDFNDVHWEKVVGTPDGLWSEPDENSVFDSKGIVEGNAKVLMGHNRFATVGEVNADNAHPFTYGHITGAHNGSLTYWKGLKDSHKFEVDSKALFYDISHNGLDKTWENFYGAAALTFWDNEKKTLNFVRNFERPLHFAWNKSKNVLIWASEKWMITVAASRNKIPLYEEKGETYFEELPVNKWRSYEPKTLTCELVEEVEVKKKYSGGVVHYPMGFRGSSTSFKGNTPPSTVFVPNTKWKKGTTRSKLNINGVTLHYIRRNSHYVRPNTFQETYRFTLMDKNKKEVGLIDVHPTNNTENSLLDMLLVNTKMGAVYNITLVNKPRENKDKTVLTGLPLYCCSASSIDFECVQGLEKIKTKDKEEEVEVKEYIGPYGTLITEERFNSYLKEAGETCCYCCNTLFKEDHKDLQWIASDSCLCPECSRNWGTGAQYMYGGMM